MRKINAIITAAIIIVFIMHGILGSFMMTGRIEQGGRIFAWIGCVLIIMHTIIGFIITGKTIKSGFTTKKWYLKQNKEFWIRRISGLFIFIIMFMHFSSFRQADDKLAKFLSDNLIIQLIFLVSIFIHLSTNIRPMLISMGIALNSKIYKVLTFLSVVLFVLFCSAVIFYYIRWNLI